MEDISVITVEQDAFEWFCSVVQKSNNILEKIKVHKPFSEEDTALLKVFYKIWDNGDFPLYRQKMEGKEDKSVQSDIFGGMITEDTDNNSDDEDNKLIGTNIDNTVSEPINEEDNV